MPHDLDPAAVSDAVPPLRVTVRLAHGMHHALAEAARRQGVSLAAYLREGALMRYTWELGVRDGLLFADHETMYARLKAQLDRYERLCAEAERLGVELEP